MSDQSKKAYQLLDTPESVAKGAPASAPTAMTGTRLVNVAKAANMGAFHCSTCDATFTSYDTYLDHVNSRLHQRNAGIRATERVDDPARIRERLVQLREQRAEKERQQRRLTEDPVAAVQERMERRRQQEEAERQRQRELRQQQRHQKKQQMPLAETEEASTEEAALMASVLGITSFK